MREIPRILTTAVRHLSSCRPRLVAQDWLGLTDEILAHCWLLLALPHAKLQGTDYFLPRCKGDATLRVSGRGAHAIPTCKVGADPNNDCPLCCGTEFNTIRPFFSGPFGILYSLPFLHSCFADAEESPFKQSFTGKQGRDRVFLVICSSISWMIMCLQHMLQTKPRLADAFHQSQHTAELNCHLIC